MRYITFDRTRHENFEKCPRLRLITHEYPVTADDVAAGQAVYFGLERAAMAVPLLSGSTVHKGLETFAVGQDEQAAVDNALQVYDQEATERGIDASENGNAPASVRDNPDTHWTLKVQRLLCEALIRGWVRVAWPKVEAEYEVVDVEQEERLEVPLDEETVAVLLARSDLIMRRKADGRYFVFNHKTINEPTDRKLQALRYDTQSISEVLAAQARYDAELIPTLQIDGVIYDLLVKGPRKVEYPKGSGIWHNNSPLIWCYVKEGQTAISPDEIAARYEYTCTAPHKMYRKECPGGAVHKLGPQWHRKLISEVFTTSPVVEWLMWLEQYEPELLKQQFQTQAPIMRTPWDIEVWKRCVLTEEWGIADRAEEARAAIALNGYHGSEALLDMLFPKHTAHGNCFWPSKCPAFQACWEGPWDNLIQIENNDGRPAFVPRRANHPEVIISDAE